MTAAPRSDSLAWAGRLVDRLAYRDEALAEAERRAGDGAKLLHPGDYLHMAGGPHDEGARIAVIHAVGEIADGGGKRGFSEGLDADASRLAKAFDAAAKDPDVRAVLFRIDSPGGSATASETIRRGLIQAKKAGKPVIASMGDMAASGGYWVAMDADRIIAAPGTLTGSIGVVTGRLPLAGAFAKIGVTWERVGAVPGAGFWSPFQPMNPAERAKLAAATDDIYNAFLRRVGEARHMPAESVRAAAQGRVWTGAQARERGLVDELGGRREALAAVRRAAKLPADAPLALRPYPAPKSPWEEALSLLERDGGFTELLRAATRIAAVAPQVERLAQWAQMSASPAPALAAPAYLGGGHGGRP